ncbi:hypothetical protein FE782_25425 [Paenibacillus antri]|uniref:Uncharacterized protein n=1 Tax=Paenibacillus antri TaxID=2582848 RepID=A0A5R9G7P9_9BACL|nr:hypothetical protein [Paenibacillus antri]TLS49458.1 hypothetical protein FE782_25425 [Paenibacillus antri]
MANQKHMHPMSGDRVETNAVYKSQYGYEIELRAGETFPMDPQLGSVEYEMAALSYPEGPDDVHGDRTAAAQAHVPVSAANEEKAERKQVQALQHRLHRGNR